MKASVAKGRKHVQVRGNVRLEREAGISKCSLGVERHMPSKSKTVSSDA